MSKRDKFKNEVEIVASVLQKIGIPRISIKHLLLQRKKERIKRIIKLIERIWKKRPELRLCQLIGNCFDSKDLYHKEDDELEKRLRDIYKEELK